MGCKGCRNSYIYKKEGEKDRYWCVSFNEIELTRKGYDDGCEDYNDGGCDDK